MCTLIEQLKREIPHSAIVKTCIEQGCRVSMKGAPSPHIIINMNDCSWKFQDKIHCDFIFVGFEDNYHWNVPLELKKGSPDATKIVEQLQAGARFTQDKIPEKYPTRFVPVGAYGGRLHKSQRDKFRRERIRFRHKEYEIKLIHCGTPLKNALT